MKIAALLFPFAFMIQPAHALRCVGYVSLDNGATWVCAGYATTSPCEVDDSRCIPVPPKRVGPATPTSPGAPPPGASSRGDTLAPEEMSCNQLNQQITAQQKIIDLLNADIAKATRDLGLTETALAGPLSENSLNAARAEKTTACDAWQRLQMTDPDMVICREPANNKPPVCRTRKLKPAEQSIKNACDAKSETERTLRIGRDGALRAKTENSAIVIAADRKKKIATAHLQKLRDAKRAKGNCP